MVALLHALVGVGLAVHAVLLAWVVVGRLRFPFELEWMTGSTMDHVERVRAGSPLYVAPSAGFVPFLYPPLYYWVVALLGGSALAARLVSIGSVVAQAVCAFFVAGRVGAKGHTRFLAPGIIVASFSYVGFWYDVERSDMLCGALLVGGAFVLLRARGAAGHVVAGVVLASSVLCKQQASFYIAGAAGALGVAALTKRARVRDVLAFVAAAGAMTALLFAVAAQREGAWFVYYVFRMPGAHGLMPELAPATLPRDVGQGWLLFGATLAFLASAAVRLRRGKVSRGELVLAGMLGAAFAAAIASRLHIGGWINVLHPWNAFAAIAAAAMLTRAERRMRGDVRGVALTSGACMVQLAMWAYDPAIHCPSRHLHESHEQLVARVRAFEARGPVLVPGRGHMSQIRRFHVSALADVARVDHHVPADLVAMIEHRELAAIFDDARRKDDAVKSDWPPIMLEDFADVRLPLLSNYYVSERLSDEVGLLPVPSPARPVFIYRPRKRPLTGEPMDRLRERQLTEMRIASWLLEMARKGDSFAFGPDDVEEMANRAME